MVMQAVSPNNAQPFTEAKVTIIEGEQGSGKSVTGVAKVKDAYDLDCVRVFCEKHNIRCVPKGYDTRTRIAKIRHQGTLKLFKVPESYNMHSPMRIFCNFHLFGIPFVYCPSFSHILKWLKGDIIKDGWLLIDEYYIGGNARESMTALGRELNKQSFQYRKMQLHVVYMTPMARLIDWTARIIPTERIECEYNPKNGFVTLKVKKRGQRGTREVTYDSKPYRKYYWTNERINA